MADADGNSAGRVDVNLSCPTCGYDITGLPENRCPECGNHFDPAELHKAMAARKSRWVWALCVPAICWVLIGIAMATTFSKNELAFNIAVNGMVFVMLAGFSISAFAAVVAAPGLATEVDAGRRGTGRPEAGYGMMALLGVLFFLAELGLIIGGFVVLFLIIEPPMVD